MLVDPFFHFCIFSTALFFILMKKSLHAKRINVIKEKRKKDVHMPKNIILTSQRHAKHPFMGQSTQQKYLQ